MNRPEGQRVEPRWPAALLLADTPMNFLNVSC